MKKLLLFFMLISTVAFSQSDKYGNYFNISKMNPAPKGNGSTNDRTVFLNALTTYKSIFIPYTQKGYKIEGNLNIPAGCRLIFDVGARFVGTGVIIGNNTEVVGCNVFGDNISTSGTFRNILYGAIEYYDAHWDDLIFPAIQTKQGATDKPTFNVTDIGLNFPYSDSTHLTLYNVQLPHSYKSGSDIYPHVHYIQPGAADTADWILKYRWVNMGDTVTPYIRTDATDCTIFTYPDTLSPDMHQLAIFPAITGTNKVESSILDIILFRKEDVGLNGTILLKDFDIHFEIDKPGSSDVFPN